MALSAPPPPPDAPEPPPTTASMATVTTTSITTATTRPSLSYPRPPNPYPHPHQQTPNPRLHSFYSSPSRQLPSNPNPSYPQLAPRPSQSDLQLFSHHRPQDPSQLLYPVASSGRGFLPRPATMHATRPVSRPPFLFSPPDLAQGNPSYAKAAHLQHAIFGSGPVSAANIAAAVAIGGDGGVIAAAVKGVPVSSSQHLKIGPSTLSSDGNGYKDLRDRSRDDSFTVIGDRKVRISENASLYALCRSWLKNGFPEETQPQYLDVMKCLPRPLPVVAQQDDSPVKREGDKEEEEKDDEESLEHISTEDLLKRHIKRAKRVRSRLREERLQRITRYKTRLALLLPPMVEQHLKNESAPAN